MVEMEDLTGRRFGKLIVVSFNGRSQSKGGVWRYFWNCRCDCGNTTIVKRPHLISGNQISCGCMLNRKGKESALYGGYEDISGKFFGSIKRGAVYGGRKFDFKISIEYLWNLFIKQNRKCILTGLELSFPETSDGIGTASLDRIDSSKGYIEGNVQWVHKDINLMKNYFNENYFIEMCKKVASHT